MQFRDVFADEVGYDELKKHIRQSGEFSASLLTIFQERSEIEATYAKSIAKLGVKALKCNKDSTGTLMAAWNLFCEHLKEEAELHKAKAESIQEDIFKKLKLYSETYHKNRKASEGGVDKACKLWHEKCNELVKVKKSTHMKTKESEVMQVVLENPAAKGKVLSDKELGKLQNKSKKANDVACKADADYLNLIKTTERTRHDFEKLLRQAATAMEHLEKERIEQHRDVLVSYTGCLTKMQPAIQMSIDTLMNGFNCIDPADDIIAIAQQKGKQPDHVFQLLYDCYEEDLSNHMAADRRRHSLLSKVSLLDNEIQKESKAKSGIARLSGAYTGNPNYADNVTQDDVMQQLTHSEEMLNMLRACKFKINSALALVDKQPIPSEQISSYITTEKKKQQGASVSVLKMPKTTGLQTGVPDAVDGRGMGDGAHVQLPPSSVEDAPVGIFNGTLTQPVIGQCIARFDYQAVEAEEMSIHEGDNINIIQKHEDGWWYGETGGKLGNFPGAYVDLL